MRRVVAAWLVIAGISLASGCGGAAKASAPSHLTGLFKIAAGHCSTAQAKPTGSYLLVLSAAQARATRNAHGGCANPDYTALRPGTDGGLQTGRFQSGGTPAFDAKRNATARRIIAPVRFGQFRLGFATSSRDEQGAPSGAPLYPAPSAIDNDGTLSVDLRSLVMTYAGRPDSTCAQSYGLGCWDLGSKSAGGTYDATTHRFAIDWFSGESFIPTGDSIEVHLEGTFVPGGGT